MYRAHFMLSNNASRKVIYIYYSALAIKCTCYVVK